LFQATIKVTLLKIHAQKAMLAWQRAEAVAKSLSARNGAERLFEIIPAETVIASPRDYSFIIEPMEKARIDETSINAPTINIGSS
jgi:hypothetical protein